MIRSGVDSAQVLKLTGSKGSKVSDLVVVEEPLEIRIGYGPMNDRQQMSIAVTMRTPGNDLELAIGFLITEGIISSYDQIESIKHCEDLGKAEQIGNVVRAELKPHIKIDTESLSRNFYVSSSCGVCGKSSIEAIEVDCEFVGAGPFIPREVIKELPAKMEFDQLLFKHTGGIHAAGLFNIKGELILTREDVGRHNAVDKLIGAAEVESIDMSQHILCLSGRAGFELVQKAVRSRIAIVASVSAPSSLAVELAIRFGLTLIGFLRGEKMNIYTNPDRIVI